MAHAQRKVRDEVFGERFSSENLAENLAPTQKALPACAISQEAVLEYKLWKKRRSARWAITSIALGGAPVAIGSAVGHPIIGGFVSAFLLLAVALVAFGCTVLDNSFSH